MKAYGGVDVWIHIFLTLTLVEGEWSASRPGVKSQKEKNKRSLKDIYVGARIKLVLENTR
jgi:hypothetical protein